MQKMYSSSSLGFQLQTQPIKDRTCIVSEGQDFCYDGQFLSIVTMQQNYWNYDNHL
jgi:hypothetical protein